MSDQIFTKWHKALEAVNAGRVCVKRERLAKIDPSFFDLNELQLLFGLSAYSTQHYVLSEPVKDLLQSKLDASMEDLIQAGITNPPFDIMTVESDIAYKEPVVYYNGEKMLASVRTFVLIVNRDDNFPHSWDKLQKDAAVICISFELVEIENSISSIVMCPYMAAIKAVLVNEDNIKDIYKPIEGQRVAANCVPVPGKWVRKQYWDKLNPLDYVDEMNDMGYAYQMMMVLMNTKGITKDKIKAPVKLNKNREKANKAPIPDHIVIRIGHYYDREGREHSFTGRHVRVHWRAGHTRRQHIGPREMQATKLIYVHPCLVNYEPGSPEPEKPTRIVVS